MSWLRTIKQVWYFTLIHVRFVHSIVVTWFKNKQSFWLIVNYYAPHVLLQQNYNYSADVYHQKSIAYIVNFFFVVIHFHTPLQDETQNCRIKMESCLQRRGFPLGRLEEVDLARSFWQRTTMGMCQASPPSRATSRYAWKWWYLTPTQLDLCRGIDSTIGGKQVRWTATFANLDHAVSSTCQFLLLGISCWFGGSWWSGGNYRSQRTKRRNWICRNLDKNESTICYRLWPSGWSHAICLYARISSPSQPILC